MAATLKEEFFPQIYKTIKISQRLNSQLKIYIQAENSVSTKYRLSESDVINTLLKNFFESDGIQEKLNKSIGFEPIITLPKERPIDNVLSLDEPDTAIDPIGYEEENPALEPLPEVTIPNTMQPPENPVNEPKQHINEYEGQDLEEAQIDLNSESEISSDLENELEKQLEIVETENDIDEVDSSDLIDPDMPRVPFIR